MGQPGVISDCVKIVWNRKKNMFLPSKKILDSAELDITDYVRSIMKCYSILAVIPEGLIKKLQP